MAMVSSLKNGDIVLAKVSKKNGRIISYAKEGKVILFDKSCKIKPGFVKIECFQVLEKVIIAKGTNVLYDYYEGISEEDLCKSLENIGFTEEYRDSCIKNDCENYFVVFANLKNGAILTYTTWNTEERKGFNTVELSMPTNTDVSYRHNRGTGFSHGSRLNVTFSIKDAYRFETPINSLLFYCDNTCNWQGVTPSLWWYKDENEHGEISPEGFIKADERIYEFKDNIDSLFNIQMAESIKRSKEYWKLD